MTGSRWYGTLTPGKAVALTVVFLLGIFLSAWGFLPALLCSAAALAYLWIAVRPLYAVALLLPAGGVAFWLSGIFSAVVLPLLCAAGAAGLIFSVKRHLPRVQSTLLIAALAVGTVAASILLPTLVNHGRDAFSYLADTVRQGAELAKAQISETFRNLAQENPAAQELLTTFDEATLQSMIQTAKALSPALLLAVFLVAGFLTTSCYRFFCLRMEQAENLPGDPDPLVLSPVSAGIFILAFFAAFLFFKSPVPWAVATNLEILLVPGFAWCKGRDYFRALHRGNSRSLFWIFAIGLLLLLSPWYALETVALFGAFDRIADAIRARKAPPAAGGTDFFDNGNF